MNEKRRKENKVKEFRTDVDWVTARWNCTLVLTFQQLKTDASSSVTQRRTFKDHLTKKFLFEYRGQTDSEFMVLRRYRDDETPISARTFALRQDRIVVIQDQIELFYATVHLNNAGSCRLYVDGKELERWQFLMMALEEIFWEGL
jgi:hypothetical protein